MKVRIESDGDEVTVFVDDEIVGHVSHVTVEHAPTQPGVIIWMGPQSRQQVILLCPDPVDAPLVEYVCSQTQVKH